MKRLIYLHMVILVAVTTGWSQKYQVIDEKSTVLAHPGHDGVFALLNINGPVEVKGTKRNDIRVNYKLEVKPRSSRGLEHAKSELHIEIKEMDDSVVVALDGPFVNYYRGNRHINIDSEAMEYWFRCTMEVEVPEGINLHAATINDGDVTISNVKGAIVADNINGNISLRDVDGKVVAETINGDMTINFLQNPGDGSHFQTINGNIKTVVPEDLSARVAFKSMNGEFYTDFDYQRSETGRVVKGDDRHGTHYKIEQLTRVKIGEGQSSLFYETLNGNMYLRKLN